LIELRQDYCEPNHRIMKVCVYGAGAIGSHLAARLFRDGAQVSVIARGHTLAAVRANGIVVKTPTRSIHARVNATDDPGALGPQDAVVVAVKAQALPSIANGLAALIGSNTNVAFVMNGIPWWYLHGHGDPPDGARLAGTDHDTVFLNTVGVANTIGGVIFSGCDVVKPGVVHVENPKSRLVLGRPDGRVTANLEALAALFRADDFIVEVTQEIRRHVWTKLQMVICSGLFGCLTGLAPKWAYTEPGCEIGVRRIAEEVTAIAQALGFTIDSTAETLLAAARNQTHKPSIVQDFENHRSIEFDAIFDAPLKLARLMEVSTPTFSLMAALVKARLKAPAQPQDQSIAS
jgi:2-dehydropantoate 2-reductase